MHQDLTPHIGWISINVFMLKNVPSCLRVFAMEVVGSGYHLSDPSEAAAG